MWTAFNISNWIVVDEAYAFLKHLLEMKEFDLKNCSKMHYSPNLLIWILILLFLFMFVHLVSIQQMINIII